MDSRVSFRRRRSCRMAASSNYDTRDKSVDLTRGVDLYGRVASNDGMSNHSAFADYGWLEAEFDARGHIPLGSSRTSLAMRSKRTVQEPKRRQPDSVLRSVVPRRTRVRPRLRVSIVFAATIVLIVSAEIRRTVYKKTDHRGVDIFAFADSGQVWGDSRSIKRSGDSCKPEFPFQRTGAPASEAVLQYRHSRALAARLEVGRSNEGIQIYASMSRGF